MHPRSAKSYIEERDRVSALCPGETVAEWSARVEAFDAKERARYQAEEQALSKVLRDLETEIAGYEAQVAQTMKQTIKNYWVKKKKKNKKMK